MYLVVTRSFPPELGGMQNLMWGLATRLYFESIIYDKSICRLSLKIIKKLTNSVSFSIERISGTKLLKKI